MLLEQLAREKNCFLKDLLIISLLPLCLIYLHHIGIKKCLDTDVPLKSDAICRFNYFERDHSYLHIVIYLRLFSIYVRI